MKDKTAVTSVEIKIALAAKHKKDFFLTEVKSGPTQIARAGSLKILDGLAIRKSWTDPCFTGYEVKISCGDFLRDAKFYTYTELCNCLYIVCPKGMIDRAELPESIGLMYYDPEKKAITTRKRAIYRKIEYTPEMLLYIIFSRLESDRYPFFSSKQEYFEAYLAGKTDNRILASAIRTKLVEENVRLEREVEKLNGFSQRHEEYRAIKKVLDKHMIWGYGEEIGKRLDKALSSKCPENISDIRFQAERLAERLRAIEAKGKSDDPLTLEDLKEMNGEPVWREQPGYDGRWVLVDCFWSREGVIYLRNIGGSSELAETAFKEGVKVYRHKPSRKEAEE